MKFPRLQLHLSTLLIVTSLAAGLVWLNVRKYGTGISIDVGFIVESGLRLTSQLQAQGWPWPHHTFDEPFENNWHTTALAGDIFICLALLAVATVAIEWLTRRMKRGAP